MKTEPYQPNSFPPCQPSKRMRITSVRCGHSAMTVGFELHDESVSIQTVVNRLVAKHGVGGVFESDSTTLDIWVTPK